MRTVDNLHDLQTLDTALAEERRRLEKVTLGLADRAAVDQSEQQLRDARQALKRIETDQRDQELATDSQRATVRDIERKLFGGKVVSPKELGNLSKEAEMLRKQISSKEDRLIELYDRLEAAHQAVTAAEATLATLKLDWSQAAAMGDDWPDLPVMRRAAFACAPANAHVEVRAIAHYVTERQGGAGAVRELCDLLMTASGNYVQLLDAYLQP